MTNVQTEEAVVVAAVKRLRAETGSSRRKRLQRHFTRYWQLWIMVLPAIAFIVVFSYIPMYGIQLAFREFDVTKGLTGGQWVGFKYFEQFFNNPQFGQIILNTVTISLWTLVMGFITPVIMAILINQIGNKRIKGFTQTITYMPHFISTVVMVAILQIFLTPGSGIMGRLFGNTSLLGDPAAFAHLYWISEIWQHTGWNCIIYLAALSSVDVALYEAAKIDGAGRLQLIRHVDMPALLPTAGILLILNMGSVLGVGFEKVYLLQNTLNITASEVISTYTYRVGILGNQFSYSTAIGLFNALVNFGFLILANYIAKKSSNTSIF
ncbi:sugar ABC transporter permease [Arthrobacter sp. MYb23]|uniref:ABC transporter permease n=1 Tax=unclassified Arthrobacter TaxID=235627 RepID=UPI000CFAD73F|nr:MULTISPECIES: ABC transporter permease subunit [unclassified Arthrobacter]PRB43451.1 sugar ABC transporter permease [Arthrobacter sp. MYb51]PRB93695.1 sugar ABC transporter permease [Arthrobacter sp. MYb23]